MIGNENQLQCFDISDDDDDCGPEDFEPSDDNPWFCNVCGLEKTFNPRRHSDAFAHCSCADGGSSNPSSVDDRVCYDPRYGDQEDIHTEWLEFMNRSDTNMTARLGMPGMYYQSPEELEMEKLLAMQEVTLKAE